MARVLSFHAGYRCQHAGACCSSDWPIPIEDDRPLRAAMADGRLRAASGSPGGAIEAAGARASAPALLGRVTGRCVFHVVAPAGGGHGRCEIHHALGHDSLPLSCRQFPRVTVTDPRGASVTLSHYCPTAAAMLDADPAASSIVVDPPGFPADGEYVGLDARDALPPLLRLDLLMDWVSWWSCEAEAVDLLANASEPVITRVARLRAIVADLVTWTPPDGPLIDRVRDAFAHGRATQPSVPTPDFHALMKEAIDAIPLELRHDPPMSSVTTTELAAGRFLAAHALANWAVHLPGGGLEAWLRSIETAHAFLGAGAGVRYADLVLRHLGGRQ